MVLIFVFRKFRWFVNSFFNIFCFFFSVFVFSVEWVIMQLMRWWSNHRCNKLLFVWRLTKILERFEWADWGRLACKRLFKEILNDSWNLINYNEIDGRFIHRFCFCQLPTLNSRISFVFLNLVYRYTHNMIPLGLAVKNANLIDISNGKPSKMNWKHKKGKHIPKWPEVAISFPRLSK